MGLTYVLPDWAVVFNHVNRPNMKLLVVNKLLINRGWRLTAKTSRIHLWAPNEMLPEERLIILPAKSPAPLPVGTLETIMRRVNQTQPGFPWSRALSDMRSLELIVEKSSGLLWGRISIGSLFLVIWGNTTTCLTTQIHEILTELITESASNRLPRTLSFEMRYDMTEVWSFLRQVRVNYVADMAGIEQATINRFISGTEFPSSEQMVQIQKSLHELGNQLLRLSS